MAYCRWSDCDVYVYLSQDGWTTHVAGRRNVSGKPPSFDFTSAETLVTSIVFRQEWSRQNTTLQPIGLPEDGNSYCHDTPGECADNLLLLKNMGYDVPQDVIDTLYDEQKDMDNGRP